jgi:hypothetical protein
MLLGHAQFVCKFFVENYPIPSFALLNIIFTEYCYRKHLQNV